ncbi:hypothetical protein AB6A40_008366 [Gnathostoma spinigerum]|uniref:Uncharacterized protein n=1 Tax=Gnathostoma spinigerum TaxID=75299 RepID=A0ABD6ER86_9BILA
MLAESEVIRYLKRKANPSSDFLSAIRVLHESEVFNTWYLEIPLPERKILGIDEVRAKFDRLARFMFNRQKMEVDSLYAEQVHTWKCALQRTGTAPTFEMEKLVERVPVTALILDL